MPDESPDGKIRRFPDPESLRLARQAGHDPKAAETIIRRLAPRVRHAVYLWAGGDPEVPDLVSTCLAEILASLGGYRGTGSLERWADGITYRVAMRQLKRKRRRERTVLLDTELQEAKPSRIDDPETRLARDRICRKLARHLDSLPQERRNTLVLRVVLGHSVPEVAELTGVPLNTARDRIRVALRELRQSLSADPEFRELSGEGIHGTG